MGKRKISYAKKLAWLRKRHVVVKAHPKKSTVNKYYSVYKIHKRPLSTPRNVALGMGKRVEAKIEKYGEKATIRTPKGKISAKRYVTLQRKKIDSRTMNIVKPIPYLTSRLNRHLTSSKKGLDVFTYDLHMHVTETNYYDVLDHLANFIHEELIPTVEKILRIRRPFYDQGEHLIGVRINFKSAEGMHTKKSAYDDNGERIYTNENVVVSEFHMTVVYRETFRSMEQLENDIMNSLDQGCGKVFDYKNIHLILDTIEIGIITRASMNQLEALRVS